MNKFGVILVLSGFLISCGLTKVTNSGFIAENSKVTYINSLKSVKFGKKYWSPGTFVSIEHMNGRILTLFVPGDTKDEINVKDILSVVENGNNPKDWPFYYCVFGAISIDTIKDSLGHQVSYHFYETVIEQNLPFDMKYSKTKGYNIGSYFVEKASFCLVSVDIKEYNLYNSYDVLQDGPHNRQSIRPIYLFDETEENMNVLLAKSEYCEN